MPYKNAKKQREAMRLIMKHRRAVERQKQKHVNKAIMEVLNDTTIIKGLKQVHDAEGNWNEAKKDPVFLLFEELVFILKNPIDFTLREKPQEIFRITDFYNSLLRGLMRPTLDRKLEAASEIARFISDHATVTNQFITSEVDRLLSDWVYWLKAYAQGSWEGYHCEFVARLKLIDAWRKMWNLKPIERPPEPQPMNREITPEEREKAEKRFNEVLEKHEDKPHEKGVNIKNEEVKK